jgi:hypothetical protein
MTYGSSGNQTPEIMEQNMLMQKIFNIQDHLGENRPSKPQQTPQTIVKGPQSKFGVVS